MKCNKYDAAQFYSELFLYSPFTDRSLKSSSNQRDMDVNALWEKGRRGSGELPGIALERLYFVAADYPHFTLTRLILSPFGEEDETGNSNLDKVECRRIVTTMLFTIWKFIISIKIG